MFCMGCLCGGGTFNLPFASGEDLRNCFHTLPQIGCNRGVNREGFLSGGSHALLVVAGASVAANSLKLVSFAFAVRWRIYRITGFAASPIFRFSLPGLISAFLGFNPPSRFIGKIASGVSSFVFGGFVLSRRPSIVQPDGTFTESFSGLQQEFSRTGRARHADIVA
jgi:hypothetical protein